MSTEYRIADITQLTVVLKSFRRARKLTQAQMAERLGVVQQSYARMESQPAATSVSNLMKMLGVLGVDLVLRDRTSMPGIGQAAPAQPKSAPSETRQTQNTSAKSVKSAETPLRKNARRPGDASDNFRVKGSDGKLRTGKVLPLGTRKDW
jgi:HTH-type transcriptional regulator/antitoxin HipB